MDKRGRFGKKAHKTVEQEYSDEATTPQLANVLKSVASANSEFSPNTVSNNRINQIRWFFTASTQSPLPVDG